MEATKTTMPALNLVTTAAGPSPKQTQQIYRNMFKAEVDLRKSLDQYKKTGIVKGSFVSKQEGILSERQRLWTSGKPNETHIENPVLHRYIKLQEQRRNSLVNYLNEIETVRGLPSDEKDPERTSSGVIDRIHQSRKERHEACLEELFQELGIISQELEPRVTEASDIVKEYLDEDLNEIEMKLNRIQNDKDLFYFTHKDLVKLWKDISEHSKIRESWIHQLSNTLHEYEEQRSSLINEVFRSYTESLLRIAHQMPPDVHRLMEEESIKVNVSLLRNKKSCTDLMRRLLTADVERERQQYLYWEGRVDDWRELKIKDAISVFESFMSSSTIAEPSSITSTLEAFVREQQVVNKKRLDLLYQLKDLRPPNSTRPSVLKWHQSFIAVTEQLDSCNAKYRGLLSIQQEKIIQQCENQLKQIKMSLFNEGVASEEDIEQISTDHLWPLIGEKKTRFDYEIEKMEKYIEDATAEQKQQFKALFTFLQGLAHHWDSHELGLTREERNLKEKLDKIRKEHDGQNQIREAKLDIVMDRLRQDSNEVALGNSLKQALTMLEEIKKSYLDFHNLQMKTVQEYPDMVTEELQRYDDSLLSYLGVARQPPKKSSHMAVQKKRDSIASHNVSPADKSKKDKSANQDFIVLASGQKFWIVPDAPGNSFFRDGSMTDASVQTTYTFLTENQNGDFEVLPYVESFKISFDIVIDLKKQLRQEFLNHLEIWKTELLEKSDNLVQAKVEEINNELDLRLHLHEPRPTRAERDVHNVRGAELVLHRDRITEHCQGVMNELHELKSQFASMVDEQKQEAEKFKRSVEDLESLFGKAGKSHELLAIQDQVSGKLDKYMTVVRATIRKFRQELDDMLNTIRTSNVNCRKSLKTFSDGGNFSPEEVEEYRKKLEKVANKIDSTEGNLMGDLEGMETKRLESAQDAAGKLEERFKHHLFDLTFIEKTSRWLTNIQLKIKSEVADSNSQAQKIAKSIATFDRRIDAVTVPNIDKEQISAKQLHETLIPLIETFHERVKYLNCGINDVAMTSLNSLKIDIPLNASQTSLKQKSEGGRRSRKGRGKGGQESGSARSAGSRSAGSKTPTSKSGTISKPPSATTERPQVKPSTADIEKDPAAAAAATTIRRKESAVRTKQGGKYDRKYLVFGEDEVLAENFHGHIRLILRDCLDGILTTAEFYYRQKGSRQPTRNTAIHDNFDHCAEAFIHRLRSYHHQTEDYHNSCIQEFRAQIKKFGSSVEALPPLVINEFCNEHLLDVESHRNSLQESFRRRMEGLERRKREYYTLLRPTLGHPKNRSDRDKLCQQEETRRKEMKDFIKDMHQGHKTQEEEFGEKFVQHLNSITWAMIGQFDALITTDDVIVGSVKPKKKTQKQLIREKITQVDDQRAEEATGSSGPGVWPSLATDSFKETKSENTTNQLEEIKSRKCLGVHQAVIRARDGAFETYKLQFSSARESVTKEADKLMSDEVRWKENWDRSLKKILDLY